MYTVCLVEDEIALSNIVKVYLERAGYEVICFSKGSEAIEYIGNKVDIWILDIMLGDDVSGYNVIKAIREKDEVVPVIFTSARDQEIDKIFGLELGSDDYMTKPYSSKELVLRVKNIITRTYQNDRKVSNTRLIIGDYEIDKERRSVSQNGETIQLTSKEYDLLLYFVNNIGMAFSRDQILNEIWGDNYFGSDRVVDDLLRRLRQKLPNLNVETIYGYGYRLTV